MKNSTKPTAKKLNKELVRIVCGMRGASAQIAATGHFHKSYVSRVIAGSKPPSRKFLLALDAVLAAAQRRAIHALIRHSHGAVLAGAQRRVIGALIRHSHPEIEA